MNDEYYDNLHMADIKYQLSKIDENAKHMKPNISRSHHQAKHQRRQCPTEGVRERAGLHSLLEHIEYLPRYPASIDGTAVAEMRMATDHVGENRRHCTIQFVTRWRGHK